MPVEASTGGTSPSAAAASLARTLGGDGLYGVADGLLGDDLAGAVLQQCQDLELLPGEVSSEAGYWATEHKPDRRGDFVHWLQLGQVPEETPLGQLGARLRAVVEGLKKLLPELREVEETRGKPLVADRAMVAHYPGEGRRFVTHIDNPNKNGRVLSLCYYLNRNYTRDSGGMLRVHKQINGGGVVAEIEPHFDRLSCVWSERSPHEVSECHGPRWAVVTWFGCLSAEDEREALRAAFKHLLASRPKKRDSAPS
eukprot:TRINITY_DN66124_c0_g1_i1.p1 TRINITY_DN66124_c0_g1~~TRINITY_DN66124_c0_g1_i1.p1  ORF type:complete len:254 (+),score=47.59 TRINITY_DN66124_c0_g1_i1:73-834(+)